MPNKTFIHILLADDDKDDRFFFAKALTSLNIRTKLTTLQDGEQLIDYLSKNSDNLPDILFLDLNMPRKNGAECLSEIKSNSEMKKLPVVIYSTSLNESIADVLYSKGAHYYMRKGSFSDLIKSLDGLFHHFEEKKLEKPSRDNFILNLQEA